MYLILIKNPYRITVEPFALHTHFICVGFNCQFKTNTHLVEYSFNGLDFWLMEELCPSRRLLQSTRQCHILPAATPSVTTQGILPFETPPCHAQPETLYHRDDALLYIAYVMLIWAAPIPADRWCCSLWP